MVWRYGPRIKRFTSESLVRIATHWPVRDILRSRTIATRGLRELATDRGKYWEYGAEGKVTFEEPIFVGSLPREIVEKVGCFEVNQPFVSELRNVELRGPHPIAVTSEGHYLLEQSLRSLPLLLRGIVAAKISSRNAPRERKIPGPLVPLVGVWNRGFFHWFSEWLPRLEGVRQYNKSTGLTPKLLLPNDPPKWMRDSLTLLGFDDYEWLEWYGNNVLVDRLVIPSLRRAHPSSEETSGYIVPPEAYEWVRKGMLSEISEIDRTSNRRILITRAEAGERRVRNASELGRAVDGLEPHTLTDLDLEAQIRLFAGAELVIGPHGAGLTNSIYAEQPVVIEAFGDFVNACYFTLSEGLGFTYGGMRGKIVEPDITIDPEYVKSLMALTGFST